MPPRPKKPTGPTPVEAIVHPDKRANLPTADAYELVTPDVDNPLTVSYPRNLRTPMLVWQGKEELDQTDLQADAPPIYIQEKVDPRVIIENLRRTADRPEEEPEMRLFEGFDGLTDLDLVEFYRHEANWSNRMILGDSLQVMASLDSRERLRGKVQMIYMDPPYGIKFGSNWQVSARKRDVRDGKIEDLAREAEQIKAFRDTWELGINSYLTYLRERLLVARELLTDSGSIFVQIGDDNVHIVRSVMDEVFGSDNFVNLITLKKAAGAGSPTGGTSSLAAVSDYVIWYAYSKEHLKYRQLYTEKSVSDENTAAVYRRVLLPDGDDRPLTPDEIANPRLLPRGSRIYRWDTLTNASPGGRYPFEYGGVSYLPPRGYWLTTEGGMR